MAIIPLFYKMKIILILMELLIVCSMHITAMPTPLKISLNPTFNDDDFTSLRLSKTNHLHDPYSILMLATPPSQSNLSEQFLHSDKTNELKTYLNLLNVNTLLLRKLMMSKLLKQLTDGNNQVYEIAPEKIKKNFDEIDKTAASFSTLNQLL